MPSKHAYLAEPDAQLMEILAKAPPPPPQSTDIHVVRQGFIDHIIKPKMDRLEPSLPSESEYWLQNFQVPVDGGEILVRCLTPTPGGKTGTETYPLLVWYHLSGWRLANIDIDDYDMRMRCVEFKTVIVLIQYRLCPENPFPASPEDAYTGLKWAVENASKIGANPIKGLIVGGASAGGGMAAVNALRARDDPFFEGRPITGQILNYPCIVYPPAVPEKFKPELQSLGDPVCDTAALNAAEIEIIFADFKPTELNDIRASPLLAPEHKNLPPALVQVCGKDPLRDEGILYEKVLRESGVQTRLHTYSGMPHAFHHVFPGIDKTKRFEQEWKDGFRWLLSFSG